MTTTNQTMTLNEYADMMQDEHWIIAQSDGYEPWINSDHLMTGWKMLEVINDDTTYECWDDLVQTEDDGLPIRVSDVLATLAELVGVDYRHAECWDAVLIDVTDAINAIH